MSPVTTGHGAFEFATSGRVVFGAGRAADLPALVDGLGSRALLCVGAHPERTEAVTAALPVPYLTFAVDGEPTVDVARTALERARAYGADLVVAVGGGSVIDLAKAVATLLTNGGDPVDHLEVIGAGRPVTRRAAPCVAVPTTAGTGAEVTANAVLTSPDDGVKVSLRSPLMLPTVALVDPELTLGCPPEVTAASGLDALTQCLEPLVSVRANPLTDALAAEGLRRAAAGLRRAYADGADLAARTDMALCSVLGGMSLANAKLGAVHGFAGVLGGTLGIPHGLACAAMLAPVVEANVRKLRAAGPDAPALGRYELAARLLTGDPDASVADGVEWIRHTCELLRVPGLAARGLRPEHVDHVLAATATASSTQGNPVPLDADELRAVLAAAL